MPSRPLRSTPLVGQRVPLEAISATSAFLHANMVAYLLVLLYAGLTVVNITDEALFYADKISLPVIKLEIPLSTYVFVAPILLLAAHTFILLLHHLLVRQVVYGFGVRRTLPYPNLSPRQRVQAMSLAPSLPVLKILNRPPHFLPRLLAILSHTTCFLGLPLFVQSLMLFRFYALHDVWVLGVHKACLGLTAGLTLFLMLISPLQGGGFCRGLSDAWERFRREFPFSTLKLFPSLLIYGSTLYFVVGLPSSDPDTCADQKLPLKELWSVFSFHPNLDLSDRILSNKKLAGQKAEATGVSSNNARAMFRIGPRNLDCADFSGAQLRNLDFRGTWLDNARFTAAELDSVNFLPHGVEPFELRMAFHDKVEKVEVNSLIKKAERTGGPKGGVVSAQRADFTQARLNSVIFAFSDLESTSFQRSTIRDSTFFGVKARLSDWRKARLRDVNFTAADLAVATFRNARAERVQLSHSILVGTQFTASHLELVDFSFGDAWGAFFDHSKLVAALFKVTSIDGASFVGAEILGGVNFFPRFASLEAGTFATLCSEIAAEEVLSPSPKRDSPRIPLLIDISSATIPPGTRQEAFEVMVTRIRDIENEDGWARKDWPELDDLSAVPTSRLTLRERLIGSKSGRESAGAPEIEPDDLTGEAVSWLRKHWPEFDELSAAHTSCLSLKDRVGPPGSEEAIRQISQFLVGAENGGGPAGASEMELDKLAIQAAKALLERADGDDARSEALRYRAHCVELQQRVLPGDALLPFKDLLLVKLKERGWLEQVDCSLHTELVR